MGLLDSLGFDNIELWRSEEMQLVQVCEPYQSSMTQQADFAGCLIGLPSQMMGRLGCAMGLNDVAGVKCSHAAA
jgi:hypothetical protein